MSRVPPPVGDKDALERLVRTYAREKLRDPAATLYGHSGHTQDGLDVIAHDGEGALWGFQCKATRVFEPADVDAEVDLLLLGVLRPDHYLIVTTANVSPAVHQRAEAASARSGVRVKVWEWSGFEAELLDHVSVGPWLSVSERARLRSVVARASCDEWHAAGPLYPLRSARLTTMPRLRDVLVAPRVAAEAAPGTPGETLDALLARKAGLSLVSGPAGAGKTVALLEARSILATRVAGDPTALLPALVSAAELAAEDWPGPLSADERRLWQDAESEWVVLCDGLDQVPTGRELRRVERQLMELSANPRVHAVVATCRTFQAPAMLPAASRFKILPWGPADVAGFRAHWSAASAAGTRSPLEATLDVIANEPGRGRLVQLDAVVNMILGAWAQEHGWLPDSVRRLRAELELLAYEVKRAGRQGIDDADIRGVLLRAGNSGDVLDVAVSKLGLLEAIPGGFWRFALPLTGDALGAAHVARCGPGTVRDSMSDEATAALSTLAFVRLALQHASVEVAARLVFDSSEPSTTTEELRRIRAIVEAAREVGLPPGPYRETLARRLARLAIDETRAWVRAAAQSIINELLAGAVEWAEDIGGQLIRVLKVPGDRVAWLEANVAVDAPADRWLEILREDDPASRSLAIRRLAAHLDRVDVREALLWSVVDGAFELTLGAHQPAHEAGVALATAARDEWWRSRARPWVLGALRGGGQFTMVGAALALGLDEEADEGRLYAFRNLGGWMSEAVNAAIDELRQAHGDDWVSRRWPDAPMRQSPESDRWPRHSESEEPASGTVQRELKTAVAPALARADVFAALPPSLSHDPAVLYSVAQGHAGRGEPVEVLMRVVTGAHVPFIPPPAQVVLGNGTLTRPAVAHALYDLWDHRESRLHVPSQYPGVALDALAARGDAEAGSRYAEWLPHSPFFQPLVPWWSPPSVAALRQGIVRDAAANMARDVLRRAESRELAVVTTGTVLHALRDAWLDDAAIREPLIKHALDQPVDEEWFDACLFALDDAVPQQIIERVVSRVRRWREESRDSLRFIHQLPSWLRVVERTGVGAAVEAALIEIVRAGAMPAAYRAAVVLGRIRTDGADWAEGVAARWPLNWYVQGPIGLDDTEVRALVGAAPAVWAARMGKVLAEFGLGAAGHVVDMISLLLEFSGELDDDQRSELIDILQELSRFERLWLPGDYGVRPARRLSDCAQAALLRAEEA